MFTVYLVALAVGGTLLAASLVLGGDQGDAEAGDLDVDGDAALAWLPLVSLRFWIFFAAFFGLTGALLTWAGGTGAVLTGILAAIAGVASGWGVVAVLARLGRGHANSAVGTAELVGCDARVVHPVGPQRDGKVRAEIKGRRIELLARSEDGAAFERGDLVVIYGIAGDGCALVTRGATETKELSA